MSKKQGATCSLTVLNRHIFPYDTLSKKWGASRSSPETSIQKFIQLNEKAFRFLGITAQGTYTPQGYALQLTTSRYAGAATLLSPRDGVSAESLVINGKYGEDVAELMSLIGAFVRPEFNHDIRLKATNFVVPPLYTECLNFIRLFDEAEKYHWRKFVSIPVTQPYPSNSTRWETYAARSYDPTQALNYPNKPNTLTTQHPEWHQLLAVLSFAIEELSSPRTPQNIQTAYHTTTTRLKRHIATPQPLPSRPFVLHSYDPILIKQLKSTANHLIAHTSHAFCAWRMDYAEFYERYVQYIFTQISQRKGIRMVCNPKYNVAGAFLPWGMRYIEPDIVLQGSTTQYVVDAKYKAHLYNLSSEDNDELRETFRHDLHQILAYTSFQDQANKSALLVYPASSFVYKPQIIKNPLNGCRCTVSLVGIPLKRTQLEATTAALAELIS